MKVIHFPTSTGGMSWELAQGEKKLGLDSSVFYKNSNWLEYPCDIALGWCGSKHLYTWRKIQTAYAFSKEYDVFHMNYGSSLIDFPNLHLDYLDLMLYKNKKVCVTYNGCDARQKYHRIRQAEISACHYKDCYDGICLDGRQDKVKARRIKKLHRKGVTMFAVNPDLLNFLPDHAVFLPYPIDESLVVRKEKYQVKDKIRIVHAPTQRAAKGTDDVLEAVERIQRLYPDTIELRLIERVKHEEAMKLYREADLVIDQLRVGWYGGLAMETMCIGIPTIAYINPDDLHFLPPKMAEDCLETVISANKNTLFSVLENIVNNPQILYQKHEASMEYVHRWHAAEYVASITKRYYES